MTTEQLTRVEIRRSTKKLLLIFVIGLLFTAGGVAMTLHPDERYGLAGGVLVLAFFGLCTLASAWQLIQARRPAFILTDLDFSTPSIVSGPVSWGDVHNVYVSVNNRSKSLHLVLYPATANRLAHAGFPGWLARRFGWRSREIVLPLATLDVDPDKLTIFVASKVEDAKAERPAEADAVAPAEPKVELGAPYFSISLSVILAAIFACELAFGPFPAADSLTPSVGTLFAMGGSSFATVRGGDWWRLFTAPLLHASVFHLLLNVVALLVAGFQLERLIGSAWFAGVFAVSALAGSTASIFFNPQDVIGVGASGGVVGLFAATAVASCRFPPGPERNQLRSGAFQILLPSLLPLLSVSHGAHIDYAAHFGGAAGGLAAGLLLLRLWPIDRPKPAAVKLPIALAAGFFVVAIGSAAPILPRLAQVGLLALDFPEDWEKAKSVSTAALAQHPRDPRVRLAHAAWLIDHDKPALAENELRAALADGEALRIPDLDQMEARIRLLLVAIVIETRRDEAKKIIVPVCASPLPDYLAQFRDSFALCP